MSWISNNYEKVFLGGAAVATVALVLLGWSAASSVEDDLRKPTTAGGHNDTGIAGVEDVAGAASALASRHVWQASDEDGRPDDLFVGPPLFARAGEKEPVDLWKGQPVHPPIDNRWWLTHHIDCTHDDAPQQDADKDGYTNLEEFEGKTDPSDPRSHPELIAKLSYVKDNSYQWVITFTSDLGPAQLQFKFFDNANPEGIRNKDYIGPGANIFAEGPGKDRFKLLEVQERKVHNDHLNIDEDQKVAIIEDQKANKKGERYEVPRKIARANIPRQLSHFDRKAVFELRAAGLTGKEFEVEERTAFGLPPENPQKNFFLKEVTPEGVTVEWKDADGASKTVRIRKGGLPEPQT